MVLFNSYTLCTQGKFVKFLNDIIKQTVYNALWTIECNCKIFQISFFVKILVPENKKDWIQTHWNNFEWNVGYIHKQKV